MATIQTRLESFSRPTTLLMSSLLSCRLGSRIRLSPSKIRGFCAPSLDLKGTTHRLDRSKKAVIDAPKARVRVLEPQLKENWLDSLHCPFPGEAQQPIPEGEEVGNGLELDPKWVIGIDPDVSGALAILKADVSGSGWSAQVFDNPHLKVVIGKRVRKRLDARSIVHLLRSFDVPLGTTAYIEQSNPFPHDGKQGWWSGGFTYGLWLGILVASGFSVVPVYSRTWKDHFELSRSSPSKDDSRKAASALFPSLSSSLKRKKDHGRAEALLIAAYGKGLRLPSDMDATQDCASTIT